MKKSKAIFLISLIFSISTMISSCSNSIIWKWSDVWSQKILNNNSSKAQLWSLSWSTSNNIPIEQVIRSDSWWNNLYSWAKSNISNTWNTITHSTKDNINPELKKSECTVLYSILINSEIISSSSADLKLNKFLWKKFNYLLNLNWKSCDWPKHLGWTKDDFIVLPSWNNIGLTIMDWLSNIPWKKIPLNNESFKNSYNIPSKIEAFVLVQLYDEKTYIIAWNVWNLWFIGVSESINKDNWQNIYNELKEVMNNTKELKSEKVWFDISKVDINKISLKWDTLVLSDNNGIEKKLTIDLPKEVSFWDPKQFECFWWCNFNKISGNRLYWSYYDWWNNWMWSYFDIVTDLNAWKTIKVSDVTPK